MASATGHLERGPFLGISVSAGEMGSREREQGVRFPSV